ncbi:SMU1112c/YaeR family gloxylase I-like metalloprotein [Suttonella ornithocola]|uniref:Putative lyase n=1 Tax=Suttonella ornithocola TaxID=279832 RepID=A0A380MZF1_9GAMM|nr:VOC family protein [Suttonella ornithocola]SUO97682.1 putative lyase [Suttonella ornithocola]
MEIHHVAVITSNYPKSKFFYSELLGLEVLAEHYREARDSWKCDLGSQGRYLIELFSFPNPPSRPNVPEACGARHIAFAVADVGQKHQALSAKGIVCEPIRIDEFTGKSFFFIKDPDGLPIEFYQS